MFGGGALATARAVRASGHEDLARVVAHQVGAAERHPDSSPAPHFPRPDGEFVHTLAALDVAILTTDQAGRRVTPREAVAEIAAARGSGDRWVRALVARIAELGDDPGARLWIKALSPPA